MNKGLDLRRLRPVRATVTLLLCSLCSVVAGSQIARAAPSEPAVMAAPSVSVAPPETRTIVAEGRAAINLDRGGIPAAREAAIAQALRAAVEKTTGVFVSARTLTSNYQLLQDEVTTRAEGFATLGDIVSEQVRGDEVRVTVRALVSLRPLAERLKALNLTRAWTVRITGDRNVDGEALTQLQQTLAEAGFHVESSSGSSGGGAVRGATSPDLVIHVSAKTNAVAQTPLDTAAGPMTLYSLRAEVGLRALRPGTGEIVAALSQAQTMAHIDAQTARATGQGRAMAGLAPRLADLLLILPARASQPITLVVANLPRIAQVGALHDALRTLPGVRSITRRSWDKQAATWELDVTTEAVPLLARALEEDASVRPFRLSVTSETRARISATVSPVASVGARGRPQTRNFLRK